MLTQLLTLAHLWPWTTILIDITFFQNWVSNSYKIAKRSELPITPVYLNKSPDCKNNGTFGIGAHWRSFQNPHVNFYCSQSIKCM